MPGLNAINGLPAPHIAPDTVAVDEPKSLKRLCDDDDPFTDARELVTGRDDRE